MFKFLIFTLLIFSSLSAASKEISMDDKNIVYRGRFDFSNPKEPACYWASSSIIVRFKGKSLSIYMSDEGLSFFNVVVDGNYDPEKIKVLRVGRSIKKYTLAEGLDAGEHELILYKRDDSNGKSTFTKIILDGNGSLLPPAAEPKLKMSFYGDSITAGAGVWGSNDFKRNNYDTMFTYAALSGRALEADCRIQAKSGIGFVLARKGDITMPKIFARINPAEEKSSWSFEWKPDLIVVNLGQNDSSIYNRRKFDVKRMFPEGLSENQMIEIYCNFVKELRSRSPKAKIVSVLGPMSVVKNRGFVDMIKKAVATLNKSDRAVYFLEFKPQKSQKAHPKAADHLVASKELTAFLINKVLKK